MPSKTTKAQELAKKIYNYSQGAVQGLSGGLSDELAGLQGAEEWIEGSAPVFKPKDAQDPNRLSVEDMTPFEALMHGDFFKELKNRYLQARDEDRFQVEQAQREDPIGTGLAELGGAVAMPTPKISKIGTKFGRTEVPGFFDKVELPSPTSWQKAGNIAKSAIEGMGVGAIQGAGHAKQLEDIPEEAIHSGAVGGLAGGAFGALASRFGARKPVPVPKGYRISVKTNKMPGLPDEAPLSHTDVAAYHEGIPDKAIGRVPITHADVPLQSWEYVYPPRTGESAMTEVSPQHQGRGLGASMYAAAEDQAGITMEPSGSLTPEGKKFWDKEMASKNPRFGPSRTKVSGVGEDLALQAGAKMSILEKLKRLINQDNQPELYDNEE